MKKIGIFLWIAVFLFGLSGCGCGSFQRNFEYKTQYTKDEHIERIEEIALRDYEKKYAQNLSGSYNPPFVEVHLIHALDDIPEYFVVEYTYTVGDNSSYVYLLGWIIDDNYYHIHHSYASHIKNGQNPFTLAGYQNAKKYYSLHTLLVETNEGIAIIAEESEEWEVLKEPVLITEKQRRSMLEQTREARDVYWLKPEKIWDIQLSD